MSGAGSTGAAARLDPAVDRALDGLLAVRRGPGPAWTAPAGGPAPQGRLFGGQVAAQALAAAQQTLPAARRVHHAYATFLRAGDPAQAVTFTVDAVRDGRTFSERLVHAVQQDRAILTLACSAHLPGDGPQHAASCPDVRDPDQLGSEHHDADGFHAWHTSAWPRWEFRRDRVVADHDGPRQRVWIRYRQPLPDDEALHARALLYLSDMTLLGCASRAHGGAVLQTASLDHALRWLRPARADQWLLYDQHSPSAGEALTVVRGSLFDRAGQLVAVVEQGGLLRTPAT